jgi:predicted KAP-like P-loop ATPase
MFEADKPITHSTQDRLGRTVFAKYLARAMLDHQNPQSLVVGLYGGWGVGKTSLINLVIEELKFAASNLLDEEKPIILNFSPWSYSGQNQLIYNFFRRLSATLRRVPKFEHQDRIIHLLELYVSFFTQKPVPKALRMKRSLKSRLLKLKNKSEKDIYGWESGKDLTFIKAELNKLLMKQKHKIIIIIDNISRIEDEEIKLIFQIVKSMGEFANSIYLLSLDKSLTINAMNRIYGSDGKEMLEKVVQLPFEVPPISKQDLENLLLDKLTKIIARAYEGSWDSKYWSDIYYIALKKFFQSSRDITRYVNTVSFGFDRVKDVVNLVDFLAITAIEIFEPHVYEGIHDNKDLFTDLVNEAFAVDPDKLSKDKLRCDEILNRAQHVPIDILQQLLIRLFPRLLSIYKPNTFFYHSEGLARKNHRICSPDLFDVYFRLSMPTGYIPESEFKAILSLANNAESFDQALTRLNQDEHIEKFLSLLDAIDPNKIPIEHLPNIIHALIDNADLFPEGKTTLLTIDTPTRIHRIIHQLLRRYDESKTRFDIFSHTIKKTIKSLYIIIHELISQEKEHNEDENADTFVPVIYRDFTPQQLTDLKKLAVERIKFWVEMNRFAEHPKLIPILFAWKEWGNGNECAQYVNKLVQSDPGLIALLVAALKIPIDQAITKNEIHPEWSEYLINIESFISIKSIEAHARALFEDGYFEKLREREQLALLIFLDLIKADTLKIFPKTTV